MIVVFNSSVERRSLVQTAPNLPPGFGRPYFGEANCVQYSLVGEWIGNDLHATGSRGIIITGVFSNVHAGTTNPPGERPTGFVTSSEDYLDNPWLHADTTYSWRTVAIGITGAPWTFKTIAKAAAFGSSSFSSVTKSSITVSVSWYPNTNESTADLHFEYKKLSDSLWTSEIVPITPPSTPLPYSGYSQVTTSHAFTGLDRGTAYQFRAVVDRRVSPLDRVTWDIGSQETLSALPVITAEDATGISDVHAMMNATIDPDSANCTVSFQYSDPDGTTGVYTAETSTQSVTGSGERLVGISQNGLTAASVYYFRAKVTYDLGAGTVTLYGDEKSFTTGASQGDLSKKEDLMLTLQFDGQYGTGRFISFTLKTKSADGSDLYYTATVPVKAECKIYKTTSAGVTTGPANATNDPTQPGGASTPIFVLELENAEMEAETVDIVVTSAGATFRDQHIQIRTAQRLSEVDIDATNGPTNATALTAIGNGTGDGIKAVGGTSGLDINAILESNWLRVGAARTQATPDSTKIRLDSASSSTNDYYNGVIVAIIGGVGVGQSRIAIDYVGGADADVDGNREITVDTAWTTTPDDGSIFALAPGPRTWEMKSPGELEDLPTETSSYGEFLRLLFQRFAFKIDQNADYQTWYKTDNTNTFASRAVEDDGNTQRLYKLAE